MEFTWNWHLSEYDMRNVKMLSCVIGKFSVCLESNKLGALTTAWFLFHLADGNKWRVIKIVFCESVMGAFFGCLLKSWTFYAIVCVPNAIISDRLHQLKELTKPFTKPKEEQKDFFNWINNESEWEEKKMRGKIHLRLLNCRWLFFCSTKQFKFFAYFLSQRKNKQKNYILLRYDDDDFRFYQSSLAHFLHLVRGFEAAAFCVRVNACECVWRSAFWFLISLSWYKKVSKRESTPKSSQI